MKLYNVEVVETLSRVVEQQANSYEEAEELVSARYSNEEIVLDYNDLDDTSYKPYPSQELKKSFSINVDFDKNTKDLWIGNEDGSGAKYKCNTSQDLEIAIKSYLDNYIELETVKPEKNLSKKSKDYER